MKLGIAGTGKIVQEALPVILEAGPDRICLMGREHSAQRTEQLYTQYHLDNFVLDYDDLLSSDIDTVYIALPNQLHYEYAGKALLAGKHVILEKPATVRACELRELFAIAASQHRILVEAMSLHHLPAWLSLKKQLPRLGSIKLVSFQFCQYSSRYDAFLRGEIAPAFDPACAGGALMDLNVYNLHAVISLFGTPRSVQYYPNMDRGIDTSGILTMNYDSFQAVSIAAKDCQAPVSSTIQGTKGCVCIPDPANQISRYELRLNAAKPELFDFSDGHHRLFWEFRAFCHMIETEDFDAADRLAKISLDVMDTLDLARQYCANV